MFTTFVICALAAIASATAIAPSNTACPVLGNAVTPGKSPIATVRGRQYYLCCAGCEAKLLKDPGKYLDKDGRPKNAPKG